MFLPDLADPGALMVAVLTIFLLLALCASLVLVVLSTRNPRDLPLLVAGGLVVLCALAVIVAPFSVPLVFGLVLALLGTTLAVVGGNPVTRRILTVATHGRVIEGAAGGIVVRSSTDAADPETERTGSDANAADPPLEVMRGGTTIGYLERLAVVLSIVAGFPEAIAVVVAVKGIGRFSELATAETRERFIIGTLASLLWACAVGAVVRLALW